MPGLGPEHHRPRRRSGQEIASTSGHSHNSTSSEERSRPTTPIPHTGSEITLIGTEVDSFLPSQYDHINNPPQEDIPGYYYYSADYISSESSPTSTEYDYYSDSQNGEISTHAPEHRDQHNEGQVSGEGEPSELGFSSWITRRNRRLIARLMGEQRQQADDPNWWYNLSWQDQLREVDDSTDFNGFPLSPGGENLIFTDETDENGGPVYYVAVVEADHAEQAEESYVNGDPIPPSYNSQRPHHDYNNSH